MMRFRSIIAGVLCFLAALCTFSVSTAAARADDGMPRNAVSVRIDVDKQMIRGSSRVTLPSGGAVKISLRGLKVLSVSINDRRLAVEEDVETVTFSPGSVQDVMVIEYEMAVTAEPRTDTIRNAGVVRGNMISPEGIVLMEDWYPSVEGYSLVSLSAVLPKGFEAISEAEEIRREGSEDGSWTFSFVFGHPAERVHLIAGPYSVEKERYGNVELCIYLLQEDRALAARYLDAAKKYLQLYDGIIGPFPFRRFSVVENVLPTGYSMPTFTLLGKDVIRLPFIIDTSLGHEILHQWFGALVGVDSSTGNWAEGLTTYLADHLYKEREGKGWEYRKQVLLTYQNYVTPGNDLPLRSFSGRSDKASQAIGYGKSAMVFHMLRTLLGDEQFFGAIRSFVNENRFRPASWDHIKSACEAASGKDLAWFFDQWLGGKGGLDLVMSDVRVQYEGAKTHVFFRVDLAGSPMRFQLPVTISLTDGVVRRRIDIEKTPVSLRIETEGVPVTLTIDEDYDLFRVLDGEESPPVIAGLLGDPGKLFVVPAGRGEEFKAVADFMREQGFSEKSEETVTYEDLKDSSVVIPGSRTVLAKRLFAALEQPDADFSLVTKHNPVNPHGVVVVVDAAAPSDLIRYYPRISHYGTFSRLAFRGRENILKATEEADRGIRQIIEEPVEGVAVPKLLTVADVIDAVKDKRIVYIGESHDRFDHHRVQLQVIRALHRRNKKIAIGMEMFQRPFQSVLDEYITGTIDEKALLKRSEYFQRWGFDYKLYREILLYAREFKVPVIALNIRKEIVSRVGQGGLQSLSAEDLKEVPEQIDLSDREYRVRLQEFFMQHAGAGGRNFDFFYQAQVLWDESMAAAVNDFLVRNPDSQVIVLAGVGHMAYGSGIPRRAHRLNKLDYAVIMNTAELERGVADYVLFPVPLPEPETPRLMVQLKEEEGRVMITAFPPGSLSEKAGMKVDDVIISLDGVKVGGIDDIKIFLLEKKRGDEVSVTVLRKRLLFGESEMVFQVRF